MTKSKPFYFDQHIFDSDDPHHYEQQQKAEKPEFTFAELEAAKAQAFEEGKRAGIQENEGSLTQQVLGVLQKIDQNMAVLHAAENDRAQKYENESVHLVHSIISKLYPAFEKDLGQEALHSLVLNSLETHRSVENLTLEVHSDILKPLKDFLKQKDAGKNIALDSNNALGLHEFRMDWPDGGLIVNRETMAQEILILMQESLAERGVTVHDEEINNDASAQDKGESKE